MDNYETAFAKSDSPFLKDIHNALICSIKSNDTTKIKLFCSCLSKFSISEQYLDNQSYKEILKYNMIYSCLNKTENIDKIKANELEILLDSIYQRDQAIREQCKQIASNYYSVCKDTIKQVDSMNLIQMNSVFEKYGFPKENELSECLPGNMPNFLWVVCHNKTQISQVVTPVLHDAVMNLSLHPQLYSFIMGGNNDSYQYQDFGLGYSIVLNGQLYVFNLEDLEIKEKINSNREKYMLDDIDLYNEKIKFQYFNPEFVLIYSVLFSTFSADLETTEMLAEKWKNYRVSEYDIK